MSNDNVKYHVHIKNNAGKPPIDYTKNNTNSSTTNNNEDDYDDDHDDDNHDIVTKKGHKTNNEDTEINENKAQIDYLKKESEDPFSGLTGFKLWLHILIPPISCKVGSGVEVKEQAGILSGEIDEIYKKTNSFNPNTTDVDEFIQGYSLLYTLGTKIDSLHKNRNLSSSVADNIKKRYESDDVNSKIAKLKSHQEGRITLTPTEISDLKMSINSSFQDSLNEIHSHKEDPKQFVDSIHKRRIIIYIILGAIFGAISLIMGLMAKILSLDKQIDHLEQKRTAHIQEQKVAQGLVDKDVQLRDTAIKDYNNIVDKYEHITPEQMKQIQADIDNIRNMDIYDDTISRPPNDSNQQLYIRDPDDPSKLLLINGEATMQQISDAYDNNAIVDASGNTVTNVHSSEYNNDSEIIHKAHSDVTSGAADNNIAAGIAKLDDTVNKIGFDILDRDALLADVKGPDTNLNAIDLALDSAPSNTIDHPDFNSTTNPPVANPGIYNSTYVSGLPANLGTTIPSEITNAYNNYTQIQNDHYQHQSTLDSYHNIIDYDTNNINSVNNDRTNHLIGLSAAPVAGFVGGAFGVLAAIGFNTFSNGYDNGVHKGEGNISTKLDHNKNRYRNNTNTDSLENRKRFPQNFVYNSHPYDYRRNRRNNNLYLDDLQRNQNQNHNQNTEYDNRVYKDRNQVDPKNNPYYNTKHD